MRRHCVVALLFAMVLGSPAAARADSITILRDNSGIAVLAHAMEDGADVRSSQPMVYSNGITATRTAVAGTTSTWASASLISAASDPANFWGTGSTGATVTTARGSGDVSASSQFAIRFALSTPHLYTFLGDFTASGDGSVPNVVSDRGRWVAMLYNGLTPVFAGQGYSHEAWDKHGVLNPGIYDFYVDSSAVGWNTQPGSAMLSAQAGFNVSFGLTEAAPVPEPASVLLLLTGGPAIVAAVRRRRNQ